MLRNVFAVGEADDGVDAVVFGYFGVCLDGVDDGCGIGEASGFEEDGVEFFALGCELSEGADEVSTDGAAYAAVVHGDEIFGCVEGFGHCFFVVVGGGGGGEVEGVEWMHWEERRDEER